MKQLRYLFLAIGIGIFAFLAHKIGWREIVRQLGQLHWWCIPIFCISLVWNVTAALGWRRVLRRNHERQRRAGRLARLGLWALFRIRIAGETVSAMTPVNFLGGDPVRIYLLKRYFPWTEGAASVVIDRTIQSMTILLTVFIGVTTAFWRIPDIPLNIRYGLPLVLAIAAAFIGFLFVHQRRGLFGFLMHTAKRLRLRREFTRPTVQRFEELDGLITDFYHRDRAGFWIAFAYHLAGRVLGVVEIYLVGALVNTQFGFVEALILAGLAPIINVIFTFIPGAMGVMEGAYTAALYLLHLPSAIGVTVQLVKRLRAGLWIALGFIALGTRERQKVLHHPDLVSSSNNRV